jgi:hypothetical protein
MALFTQIVNFWRLRCTFGPFYDSLEYAIIEFGNYARNLPVALECTEVQPMTTRLKIDLSQGILEVEGSETFVKVIYNDFKAHFIELDSTVEEPATLGRPRRKTLKSSPPTAEAAPAETEIAPGLKLAVSPEIVVLAPEPPASPAIPEPEPEPKTPAPGPTYTFLDSLELGPASDHSSLVEFMDSKLPITNEERNLVFLYYLQQILKVKPITLDHIYTCYRAAKIRAPLNLENSLKQTAEQRGWIKTASNGSMTLTPEGKLYAEKQLPKKKKSDG